MLLDAFDELLDVHCPDCNGYGHILEDCPTHQKLNCMVQDDKLGQGLLKAVREGVIADRRSGP